MHQRGNPQLCVDDPVPTVWCGEPGAACAGACRYPRAHPANHHRGGNRHGAYSPAVHAAAADRDDAPDGPDAAASRTHPWRRTDKAVPARLFAAVAARRERRRCLGVHHLTRLLHHSIVVGWWTHQHGGDDHRAGGQHLSRLATRVGDRDSAAGVHSGHLPGVQRWARVDITRGLR